MGTLFRIVLYSSDAGRAHEAIRAAFTRVSELDDKLSDYKQESELNQVCRDAVRRDVEVSPDLYTVLQASQTLAERTDGAFDVTLGPVVREWRVARKTGRLPSPDVLASAKRLTGYRKLHLRDRRVRLDVAGMLLDLGAIAKGYAADEALAVLRNRGFPKSLVAASGDIAFGDAPPSRAGWNAGVDSLDASADSFTRVLQLSNTGLSTSGDTEQFVEIGGVRYSHIVNPKTGSGLIQRIGVTVISKKAIDADSLATALSVVTEQSGPAEALTLMREFGAKGMICLAANQTSQAPTVRCVQTDDFP